MEVFLSIQTIEERHTIPMVLVDLLQVLFCFSDEFLMRSSQIYKEFATVVNAVNIFAAVNPSSLYINVQRRISCSAWEQQQTLFSFYQTSDTIQIFTMRNWI